MLDAADTIVQRDRAADLPIAEVGEMAGSSRALVYTYLPDRYRLLDALLDRHADLLEQAGLDQACRSGQFAQRAQAAALVYMRHTVDHGETIELVLREDAVVRELHSRLRQARQRAYRCLARAARRDLSMRAREALALVLVLEAMPVEAARKVRDGSLSLAEAEALLQRLMAAAIGSQAPNAQR